jgi:hypothetical protein
MLFKNFSECFAPSYSPNASKFLSPIHHQIKDYNFTILKYHILLCSTHHVLRRISASVCTTRTLNTMASWI